MTAKTASSVIRTVGAGFALTTILLCPGRLDASIILCTPFNTPGILFQFDTAFPSDPNPAGSAPWIDAYFQDVSRGTVLLTITNVQLTAGEFVGGMGSGASGGLFFNLNTSLNAANLIFTACGSSGRFTAPTIRTGTDSFKADGDGYYDIRFDFATTSRGRFVGGDSITYTITGISTLTAADFAYLSASKGSSSPFCPPEGDSGPFYAAAHVQGLCGGASTWIEPGQVTVTPVPEPSLTVLVVVGGLCLAGWTGRWRQR